MTSIVKPPRVRPGATITADIHNELATYIKAINPGFSPRQVMFDSSAFYALLIVQGESNDVLSCEFEQGGVLFDVTKPPETQGSVTGAYPVGSSVLAVRSIIGGDGSGNDWLAIG